MQEKFLAALKYIRMTTKRQTFNMAINDEDRRVITELQDKFAINVSQFLKLALRHHLVDLKKIK